MIRKTKEDLIGIFCSIHLFKISQPKAKQTKGMIDEYMNDD
ncbi:hypothetical protein [Peribacillus sp. YIM B13482]